MGFPVSLWHSVRSVGTTILAGALVAVLFYVGIVAIFYGKQRAMMYPAPKGYVAPAEAGLLGVEVVPLRTDDGETLTLWWRPPPGPNAPVALYFHGNAERLGDLAERFEVLAADGFGVAAMAYRGYPGSSGKPTEAALLADAERLHDWVGEQGVAPDRMVAIGFSLGTGVAVALADERPVGALVLYAPFTSAADVAKSAYPWLPVRALMHDQMRSDERIGSVGTPVAIVHGTTDRVVPERFGRRLYALAEEPRLFVSIDGVDHMLAADAGREAVLPFLAHHMAPGLAIAGAETPALEARAAAGTAQQ